MEGIFKRAAHAARQHPLRMKIFPLKKGGGAERQRSRSAWGLSFLVLPLTRQPPEGFAFFPPLIRGNASQRPSGDFQESFSCRGAAPRSMKMVVLARPGLANTDRWLLGAASLPGSLIWASSGTTFCCSP